jgi:hypothetical protein
MISIISCPSHGEKNREQVSLCRSMLSGDCTSAAFREQKQVTAIDLPINSNGLSIEPKQVMTLDLFIELPTQDAAVCHDWMEGKRAKRQKTQCLGLYDERELVEILELLDIARSHVARGASSRICSRVAKSHAEEIHMPPPTKFRRKNAPKEK